ncbi:MAG: hypothetical protein AVDCRST_MAG55-3380, partial [uncultured Rubrobacteraceae bacterium]
GRRQAQGETSRLRRGCPRHGAERPQDARLHDLDHRRPPGQGDDRAPQGRDRDARTAAARKAGRFGE